MGLGVLEYRILEILVASATWKPGVGGCEKVAKCGGIRKGSRVWFTAVWLLSQAVLSSWKAALSRQLRISFD